MHSICTERPWSIKIPEISFITTQLSRIQTSTNLNLIQGPNLLNQQINNLSIVIKDSI